MTLINQFKDFIKDFHTDTNFNNIFLEAQVLCSSCGIKNVLTAKRVSKRKKIADELANDEPINDPSQRLKVDIVLSILDVISISLDDRFQTLFNYRNLYGFLLNINESHKWENLRECCQNFAQNLNDIEPDELEADIRTVGPLILSTIKPLETLEIINRSAYRKSVPNLLIALQFLLTIPVSTASAERSFFEIKAH